MTKKKGYRRNPRGRRTLSDEEKRYMDLPNGMKLCCEREDEHWRWQINAANGKTVAYAGSQQRNLRTCIISAKNFCKQMSIFGPMFSLSKDQGQTHKNPSYTGPEPEINSGYEPSAAECQPSIHQGTPLDADPL